MSIYSGRRSSLMGQALERSLHAGESRPAGRKFLLVRFRDQRGAFREFISVRTSGGGAHYSGRTPCCVWRAGQSVGGSCLNLTFTLRAQGVGAKGRSASRRSALGRTGRL